MFIPLKSACVCTRVVCRDRCDGAWEVGSRESGGKKAQYRFRWVGRGAARAGNGAILPCKARGSIPSALPYLACHPLVIDVALSCALQRCGRSDWSVTTEMGGRRAQTPARTRGRLSSSPRQTISSLEPSRTGSRLTVPDQYPQGMLLPQKKPAGSFVLGSPGNKKLRSKWLILTPYCTVYHQEIPGPPVGCSVWIASSSNTYAVRATVAATTINLAFYLSLATTSVDTLISPFRSPFRRNTCRCCSTAVPSLGSGRRRERVNPEKSKKPIKTMKRNPDTCTKIHFHVRSRGRI